MKNRLLYLVLTASVTFAMVGDGTLRIVRTWTDGH
jgi:hypothetical protein